MKILNLIERRCLAPLKRDDVVRVSDARTFTNHHSYKKLPQLPLLKLSVLKLDGSVFGNFFKNFVSRFDFGSGKLLFEMEKICFWKKLFWLEWVSRKQHLHKVKPFLHLLSYAKIITQNVFFLFFFFCLFNFCQNHGVHYHSPKFLFTFYGF